MARLTLAQARTALAELLQLLDVEGSPELVGSMNRAIAAAQRTLAMRERWLIPTKRTIQALVIGRTTYASPAREGIVAVGLQMDPNLPPTYLAGGIAMDDTPYVTGSDGPQRWDHRTTKRVASVTITAGGTGYTGGAALVVSSPTDGWTAAGTVTVNGSGVITGVTLSEKGGGYADAPTITVAGGSNAVLTPVMEDIETLLLTPPPSQAWTLAIDYRDVPAISLTDSDLLVMDEMAVIYTAALMVGPSSGSPRTGTLAGEATEYLKGLRGYGAAGTSFQPGASAVPSNGLVYRNGRWYPR